jgi:hypothetical protein
MSESQFNIIESLALRGLISPPGGYSVGDWHSGVAAQENRSWWLPRAVHHLAIVGPLADGMPPNPLDPIRLVGFFVDPNRYEFIEGFDASPRIHRLNWNVTDPKGQIHYDITLYSAPAFFSKILKMGHGEGRHVPIDVFDSLVSPRPCQLIDGFVSAMMSDHVSTTLTTPSVANLYIDAACRAEKLAETAESCPFIEQVRLIESRFWIPSSVTFKQVDNERYNRASRARNLISPIFGQMDDASLERYIGLLIKGKERDSRFMHRKHFGHDTWYRYEAQRCWILASQISRRDWPKTHESEWLKQVYAGSREQSSCECDDVGLRNTQDAGKIRKLLRQILDYGESHAYNGDRYDAQPSGDEDARAITDESIDQRPKDPAQSGGPIASIAPGCGRTGRVGRSGY